MSTFKSGTRLQVSKPQHFELRKIDGAYRYVPAPKKSTPTKKEK